MSKALVIKGANFATNALDQITFDDTVHAESISLDTDTVSLDSIGDTQQLVATITPADSTDPILWASSNTNVVTVTQNGLLEAVGCGTCTITASAGSVSDTASATVAVELTVGRYPKAKMNSGASTNRATSFSTYAGSTSTGYDMFMVMCAGELPYNDSLILAIDMIEYNSTAGANEVISESDMPQKQSGMVRVLNQIGYPVPIPLPANCTKIKCTALDSHYGVIPFFFKKDVHASSDVTVDSAVGKSYWQPWRNLNSYTNTYITTSSNWTYQKVTQVNVDTDCDSVALIWRADTANGAKDFASMTESELAQFVVECL